MWRYENFESSQKISSLIFRAILVETEGQITDYFFV